MSLNLKTSDFRVFDQRLHPAFTCPRPSKVDESTAVNMWLARQPPYEDKLANYIHYVAEIVQRIVNTVELKPVDIYVVAFPLEQGWFVERLRDEVLGKAGSRRYASWTPRKIAQRIINGRALTPGCCRAIVTVDSLELEAELIRSAVKKIHGK